MWVRQGGYVARVGHKCVCTGFWLGHVTEIDHLEYLDVDGRIISNWISKQDRRDWRGFIYLRIRRDLLSAVMNFRFVQNVKNFLTS